MNRSRSAVMMTVCVLVLLWSAAPVMAQAPPLCPANLPNPQIEVTGSEDIIGGDGKAYTRYRVAVTNRASYPDALFAAAPDLPACGLNTKSSRTWVDLNDGNGARLNGFCALGKAADLASIWFAMPRGTPPPSCVTVTLKDRRCNKTYKSNCAPTQGIGPACIDFESLALGATFAVGSTFTDSGATMTVKPFQSGNGNWTSAGQVKVDNTGKAGASGKEIGTNNANVGFQFAALPNVVFLNFGEFGGNLNIEVNGDFRNFQNFADIKNTTVGGAQVAVTNGLGNDKGTLTLTGDVHSFAVGGQELALDHVCTTKAPPVQPQPGTWIMPYGVGGTTLNAIKATGFTDYTDGLSGFLMKDAPFGGHLGFRLGQANVIPTNTLYYYRLQYRQDGEPSWHDFDEAVTVHYVKEKAGVPPVFPTYALGPHDVGGKKLYRFQPHEAELPSLVPVAPGETVSWPSTGFFGDIYAGLLNTAALNLLPGKYNIRTEIYDSTGAQTLPGAGTFNFIVPTSVDPDGTGHSGFAPAASISGGGFEFNLFVDNRPTQAAIDEPKIGAVGAGECGFLRYDPPASSALVTIAFHATHPAQRALFSFGMIRGHTAVTGVSVSGAEVSALTAGAYTGDGSGNFSKAFTVAQLLETCSKEAAFAESLHVFAKATNGWHQRLTNLDSSDLRAFALTPKP